MMEVSIVQYAMNGKINNIEKQKSYGSKYRTHASIFRA